MYAQCPECLTIYRVLAEVLTRARARARCGICRAEFDLLATLCDPLPPDPVYRLTRHHPGALPLLETPVLRPSPGQRDLFDLPDETVAPTPTFAQAAPPPPRGRRLLRFANGLLLLALCAQGAYASRAEWISDARVRPWLDAVCLRLDCRLPPRVDLGLISLAARDVRPHPSYPGALIISATLLNRGEFSQPYPIVEVTLSDLDEQRIAMRRVSPQDYLLDQAALLQGIPPGANATVELEVLDPGRNAVAFEFKFR